MFEVRLSRRAERNLEALSAEDQERVLAAVEELAQDPLSASQVTSLSRPRERLYRKRIGPLRVVFTVDLSAEVIDIVALGRRGSVYRGL